MIAPVKWDMGQCLPVAPTVLLFPNTTIPDRLQISVAKKNSFSLFFASYRWGLLHLDSWYSIKKLDILTFCINTFHCPEWQIPPIWFYNHLKQSLKSFLQGLFDSGLMHTQTHPLKSPYCLALCPPPSPPVVFSSSETFASHSVIFLCRIYKHIPVASFVEICGLRNVLFAMFEIVFFREAF